MEQEYTASILESMLDAVIVVNPDGAIRTVNRAALELLGYAEEELIGQPVGMIFEEEEAAAAAFFRGSGLAQLVRDGAARDVELTLRARSGERIPVLFNGSVIREEDGRLAAVVGVARDIRERKRAEEALRQSEERYRVYRRIVNGPLLNALGAFICLRSTTSAVHSSIKTGSARTLSARSDMERASITPNSKVLAASPLNLRIPRLVRKADSPNSCQN
ncbi:MAG: PAS domain S-box protein [Anaerolineales bacterium]|nr:PAS domain S-box protein [Anaerolineales bacterium]